MAKVSPIQLQKHLKGTSYPAKKKELLQSARRNGADDSWMKILEKLPDREFATPAEVSKAVGGV